MPLSLARVRVLLSDVPKHGKLAYCLLRDERIPAAPKAALLGSLGLIFSPVDFPAWIPVLGELDMLALAILAVKVFVDACPDAIVKEHEEALRKGASAFDRDLQSLVGTARASLGGVVQDWSRRAAGIAFARPRVVEDESA